MKICRNIIRIFTGLEKIKKICLSPDKNIVWGERAGGHMKAVIKYELIINKAMRSALSYDTTDEQINEFIRFFGKHIGSDRIYIFEDNLERHVTNNTYEWCADGIVPQINFLQNVDMDVIRWWYDSFDEGKSVIIPDVEEIREEHELPYEMLRNQNVRNVVVSPLRYNNQISGFFGVG